MNDNVWESGFGPNTRMAVDATLHDYWRAPGSGPLHSEWRNKPHRLLYDLVGEVQHLRNEIQQLRAAAGQGQPGLEQES